MNDYAMRLPDSTLSSADELTPERINRLRRFRRRLAWRQLLAARIRPLALPAALLLALGGAMSLPLPVKAAHLGAGFGERVYATSASGSGNTIQYATARIAFSGTLSASARRAAVTIVVQKVSGSDAATVGAMMTTAQRVFNTQPVALPALFSDLNITAQPGATYRIAVKAGATTLTSAAVALAR